MAKNSRIEETPPKIFGIGLGRTGTKSLTWALHQLGFHISHFPDDDVTFRELSVGNYDFTLLKSFDGITDITVSYFYPHLDRLFPESKFILTVRDKRDWLDSLEKHWATHPCFNDPKRQRPEDAIHMAMRQLLCATIFGCYEFNRERASYVYDAHYEKVKAYFVDRPDDLLILDICAGDGWPQLCSFFQRPQPDIAFPKVRRKGELTSLDLVLTLRADDAPSIEERSLALL